MIRHIYSLLIVLAFSWPQVLLAQITSTGIKAITSAPSVVSANLTLNGTTAGNLVVVCGFGVRTGGPAPSLTVTDGGNSWTNVGVAGGDPTSASISWSVLGTGGNRTINLSGNGVNDYDFVIAAHEFTGQHATPNSGSPAIANGISAAADTGTITPGHADALIVACGNSWSGETMTENQSPGDTNWTLSNESEVAGGEMGSMVYHIQTGGPTARRSTWLNSSSDWSAIGQGFRPTAAASSTMQFMLLGVGP